MAKGETIRRKRTREEIITWFNAARERKEAWEKRVEERWAEEDRLRKEAEASHYYDMEWV